MVMMGREEDELDCFRPWLSLLRRLCSNEVDFCVRRLRRVAVGMPEGILWWVPGRGGVAVFEDSPSSCGSPSEGGDTLSGGREAGVAFCDDAPAAELGGRGQYQVMR